MEAGRGEAHAASWARVPHSPRPCRGRSPVLERLARNGPMHTGQAQFGAPARMPSQGAAPGPYASRKKSPRFITRTAEGEETPIPGWRVSGPTAIQLACTDHGRDG